MKHRIVQFISIVICIVLIVGMFPSVNNVDEVSASCFFSDVTNEDDFWFAPAYWGASNNIVYGYSDGTFGPAKECTRAQMVTFIWRIAGKPNPEITNSPFSDIEKSDYFYKAALWGNENHIVEGYKDGTFRPQNLCTRKQAVTFLWRLADRPEPDSMDSKFSDIKESEYFYKPVLWASELGIVAGYEDGTFKPSGKCLRRQMVTFLYKFCKNVLNDNIYPISFSDYISMDVDIDYDAIDQANRATPTPTPTPTPVPKPKFKAGKKLGKVSEKRRGSLSLEGKTAADIFKMLKSYAKVSTGDSVSKYKNRFPVAPERVENGGAYCLFKMQYEYMSDDVYEFCPSINCIYGVYCEVPQEMNGTFNADFSSYVQIQIGMNDYDVAAELYDKLYSYFVDICNPSYDDYDDQYNNYDKRVGTSWNSKIHNNVNDSFGSISMMKQDYYDDYRDSKTQKKILRTRYEMIVNFPVISKSK